MDRIERGDFMHKWNGKYNRVDSSFYLTMRIVAPMNDCKTKQDWDLKRLEVLSIKV